MLVGDTNSFVALNEYAPLNGVAPLVMLDFKNGLYTVNGSAVAVGAAVIQNNAYGAWNEARIQAGVGVVPIGIEGGAFPAFTGDALALILAGTTAVLTFNFPGGAGAPAVRLEIIDFPLYNTDYSCVFRELNVGSISDSAAIEDPTFPLLGIGTHRAAVTFINGKISGSANGGTLRTINPADPWTPAPTFAGMHLSLYSVLEKIAFYSPRTDADLPALSAL